MKKPRREGNGTEWYLKRLTETSTFRPIAGCKETKEFHAERYGDRSYFELSDQFLADQWDCDKWMQIWKNCGASYVIITAKHHDGYCMWDTNTTSRSSAVTGPRRDVLREFITSAEKYGLAFGIYYSLFEFNVPMTKEFVEEVIVPQFDELLAYNPAIFWFDGNWEIKTKFAAQRVTELWQRAKEFGCIINDRVPNVPKEENELGLSDYRVFGDRSVLPTNPTVPWESIHTVGNSWGINKYNNCYKSADDILNLYTTVTDLGGKLLLNFGPDEHGVLDENEFRIVEEFGIKLQINK